MQGVILNTKIFYFLYSNERITVNNDAISSITEDVLPTMQDDTSNLSDMIDNILTDVIPGLVEDLSSTTDTSNN